MHPVAAAVPNPFTSVALSAAAFRPQIESGTRIAEVTGPHHRSPLIGSTVGRVHGVVTAIDRAGFYIQDPLAGYDPAKGVSLGLYVYTHGAPTVSVGDLVRVGGKVAEFTMGRNPEARAGWLSTTQLTFVTVEEVLARDLPLPEPLQLGAGGLPIPTAGFADPRVHGAVDAPQAPFDATRWHVNFWESMTGMRVAVNDAVVVGPTDHFGSCVVLADGGAGVANYTPDGVLILTRDSINPERIMVDPSWLTADQQAALVLDVGDRLTQLVGVVQYRFGKYVLMLTEAPAVQRAAAVPRPVTTLVGDAEHVTIASMNVENLHPGSVRDDEGDRIAMHAAHIVQSLRSPDILVKEEIQDNNGPAGGGGTDASQTYEALIAAIVRAGGPRYQYCEVAPRDGADGGQPGGNIRVGMLYNPARVGFTPRGQAGPDDAVAVERGADGQPHLSLNPGRVDPASPAYAGTRKPLLAEFTFNGRSLFVGGFHFTSKRGDDPAVGRRQPPEQKSVPRRVQQVEPLVEVAGAIRALDVGARIFLAGDMNDFPFSKVADRFVQGGMVNLWGLVPEGGWYSTDYHGNAQALEAVFVSPALADGAEFEVLHLNSRFAAARHASDHDPVIARLHIPPVEKCRTLMRG